VLLVLPSPRSFSEWFGARARPVHPILGYRITPTGEGQRKLSSPRQSWALSGASISQSRMRVPWIAMVSPSMMLVRPVKSKATAATVDAKSNGALIGRNRIGRLYRPEPCSGSSG